MCPRCNASSSEQRHQRTVAHDKEKRRMLTAVCNSPVKIQEPSNLDILQGKDCFSRHHVGNMCFHALIGYSLNQYKTLPTQSQKGKFLKAVIESIQKSGGRFLQRHDGGGWEKASTQNAKEKVGHAYRDTVTLRKWPASFEEGSLQEVIGHYYNSVIDFDWKGIVTYQMKVVSNNAGNRMSPPKMIREPTDLDILHGRDEFSIHHIGNRCFRAVIGCSLEEYKTMPTQSEKSKFLGSIVKTIQDSGGRFLKRRRGDYEERWEQDDENRARQKVGYSLRDLIRKKETTVGNSLVNRTSDCHYHSAYDFDWRGMVERAHQQNSEMKNVATVNKSMNTMDFVLKVDENKAAQVTTHSISLTVADDEIPQESLHHSESALSLSLSEPEVL